MCVCVCVCVCVCLSVEMEETIGDTESQQASRAGGTLPARYVLLTGKT